MTQPDVSLTDYGLAVECACLTWCVSQMRPAHPQLECPFVVFFCSVAIAAAAGGTVHGFFLDETSIGHRILWPLTLIMMGVTAVSGVYIGCGLLCSASSAMSIERVALAVFAGYALIVFFVRRDFLIAILGYLPALAFMGVGFLSAYLKGMGHGFLLGSLGVCTMFLSAATQQAKLGISERYFGYNAVYHLLQAVALLLVAFAARAGSGSAETIR
jgi:hypothetical protein